jgi:hypothetical protein
MTCLLKVGKFPNTVKGLMQLALLTVETLCYEVELSVNPDKTGLVSFTRKRKLPGFFKPQFFGVKLNPLLVGQVSGLFQDFRLTWREHVDVETMKAHNYLWACMGACGARWGPKPKVVH